MIKIKPKTAGFNSKSTNVFRYLYGMPVQLTVYGHPITFATMSTVLAAIMAAFASKILIKSMTILDSATNNTTSP